MLGRSGMPSGQDLSDTWRLWAHYCSNDPTLILSPEPPKRQRSKRPNVSSPPFGYPFATSSADEDSETPTTLHRNSQETITQTMFSQSGGSNSPQLKGNSQNQLSGASELPPEDDDDDVRRQPPARNPIDVLAPDQPAPDDMLNDFIRIQYCAWPKPVRKAHFKKNWVHVSGGQSHIRTYVNLRDNDFPILALPELVQLWPRDTLRTRGSTLTTTVKPCLPRLLCRTSNKWFTPPAKLSPGNLHAFTLTHDRNLSRPGLGKESRYSSLRRERPHDVRDVLIYVKQTDLQIRDGTTKKPTDVEVRTCHLRSKEQHGQTPTPNRRLFVDQDRLQVAKLLVDEAQFTMLQAGLVADRHRLCYVKNLEKMLTLHYCAVDPLLLEVEIAEVLIGWTQGQIPEKFTDLFKHTKFSLPPYDRNLHHSLRARGLRTWPLPNERVFQPLPISRPLTIPPPDSQDFDGLSLGQVSRFSPQKPASGPGGFGNSNTFNDGQSWFAMEKLAEGELLILGMALRSVHALKWWRSGLFLSQFDSVGELYSDIKR